MSEIKSASEMSRRSFASMMGVMLAAGAVASATGVVGANAAESSTSAYADAAGTEDETPAYLTDQENEKYIVRDIQWVESLPDHTGSIGGKGFPILMSTDLLPEANAWVCATVFDITDAMAESVNSGSSNVKADRHTHECDEMYVILGPKGAIEYEITLGDDTFTVASPACVYIPEGTVHSIRPTKYTAGVYGGSLQITLSGKYTTHSAE